MFWWYSLNLPQHHTRTHISAVWHGTKSNSCGTGYQGEVYPSPFYFIFTGKASIMWFELIATVIGCEWDYFISHSFDVAAALTLPVYTQCRGVLTPEEFVAAGDQLVYKVGVHTLYHLVAQPAVVIATAKFREMGPSCTAWLVIFQPPLVSCHLLLLLLLFHNRKLNLLQVPHVVLGIGETFKDTTVSSP